MPALAWDALEAGADGPAVRRMAALNNPSGHEVDSLLPRFMAEVELQQINPELAYARVAQARVRHVLANAEDPLLVTAELESLWVRAGYPQELEDVALIHDEVQVAFWEFDESKDSIRKWVLKRFQSAANQELK